MSCGRTHDLISAFTTPFVAIIAYFILGDIINTIIITSSYLFSSYMFNGDLDTNSRPYNRWWLFKMIWIPYQIMFHHRSIFTHGLIIGTLIRLIYLFSIPIFVLYINDYNILEIISKDYYMYIIIGLESGAALHTISDYFPKIL